MPGRARVCRDLLEDAGTDIGAPTGACVPDIVILKTFAGGRERSESSLPGKVFFLSGKCNVSHIPVDSSCYDGYVKTVL